VRRMHAEGRRGAQAMAGQGETAAGPRWALLGPGAGRRLGRVETGRAFGLGPLGKEDFFSKYFSVHK
jgi:hypothetical protein